MKQLMELLKKIGYTDEDVIKMTKILPTIFGYSIENIQKK